MGLRYIAVLRCDECNDEQFRAYGKWEVAAPAWHEVKEIAIAAGWKFDIKDSAEWDLCPACAALQKGDT